VAEPASGYSLSTVGGRRFSFDAGSLCLEFATTGGEGYRSVWETLHRPADLAHWAARSRLAAGSPIDPTTVRIRAWELVVAKELREAIWFAATDVALDREPRPGDLAVLNRMAMAPPLVPRIETCGPGGRSWVTPITTAKFLSTVARDAIELFSGPLAARIRQCDGPTCSLVFVDTSRPAHRRWCSMERCGNLQKQRTFQARQQALGSAGSFVGKHRGQGHVEGVLEQLPQPFGGVIETGRRQRFEPEHIAGHGHTQ
jgi:predicted RNA-binding Zn ribbon-like protein